MFVYLDGGGARKGIEGIVVGMFGILGNELVAGNGGRLTIGTEGMFGNVVGIWALGIEGTFGNADGI